MAGESGAGSSSPASAAGPIEVEILSGRLSAGEDEVSITTIFREDTFTLLATETPDGGARELLHRHVRELFSLEEVVSLGASRVPLTGGSAIFEADGERMEIHVQGQMAGGQMVRLVVSNVRNGQEEVATSVLARRGRTVVLTAPGPANAGREARMTFVCLTPR